MCTGSCVCVWVFVCNLSEPSEQRYLTTSRSSLLVRSRANFRRVLTIVSRQLSIKIHVYLYVYVCVCTNWDGCFYLRVYNIVTLFFLFLSRFLFYFFLASSRRLSCCCFLRTYKNKNVCKTARTDPRPTVTQYYVCFNFPTCRFNGHR